MNNKLIEGNKSTYYKQLSRKNRNIINIHISIWEKNTRETDLLQTMPEHWDQTKKNKHLEGHKSLGKQKQGNILFQYKQVHMPQQTYL